MKNHFSFFCSFIFSIFFFQKFSNAQSSQPNIILIILDDLNDYVEGYNGHPQAETPNLKSIAQNGTTFTKAYCTSPQCGPSRMAMMTGKDAEYTRIYRNTDQSCGNFRENFKEIYGNEEIFTLPEYLKDSLGYFTYGINKIFHCHEDLPDYDTITEDICAKQLSWNKLIAYPGGEDPDVTLFGHDDEHGTSGFNVSQLNDTLEKHMYDYVCVDSAIQFISEYSTDQSIACNKPLFLTLGLRRPHIPLYIPQKYFSPFFNPDFYATPFRKPYNDPPNAFPYNGIVMPPQPDTLWNDFEKLPTNGVAQNMALETGVAANYENEGFQIFNDLEHFYPGITEEEQEFITQEAFRANGVIAYLAAIKYLDAQLGRFYDYLQSNPDFFNNSIIVIVSDNGFGLGEKRHWRKGNMWETDARVPCYYIDMRNVHEQVCDKPISLLDIFPTIIDALDAEEPKFSNGNRYLDGISFLPLTENASLSWEKPAVTCFTNKFSAEGSCFPQYAVKDDRFRYIHYQSNNEYGIYDCNSALSIREEELYELGINYETDPYEWNNLIANEDYKPVIQYLQQWLPDSAMYHQKGYELIINDTISKCLLEKTDTLNLTITMYDTASTLVSDYSALSFEWTNNLTNDIFTSEQCTFPLSILSDEMFNEHERIIMYLNIYDSLNRIIGFDIQYYYLNPAQEPDVNFSVLEQDGSAEIHDYYITGSYQKTWWDFGDGTVVYDFIPAPHLYLSAGTYTITNYVMYGNDEACVKSFAKQKTVSVSQLAAGTLQVYPNPAKDEIFIYLPSVDNMIALEIIDMMGNKIKQINLSSTEMNHNTIEIPTSDLPSGQYLIRCFTGNKFLSAQCIIL